jgi:hypothetical protein
MTKYQQAKQHLKNAADLFKSTTNDIPAIREYVNNVCDSIVKDTINCPSWNISDSRREQYTNWLHNYACKLHPKK